MIAPEKLKDLLHRDELSRPQQMLLCLAVSPLGPRQVADVRSVAVAAGLTAAKNWNVSSLLSELRGLAVRVAGGWELNAAGKAEAIRLSGGTAAPAAASTLRTHLTAIRSPETRAFVEEAVGCIESGHYRAAVVLSWVGALAVLYDHVVSRQVAAFNAEARRRDAKWRDAKTADDLARLKEHDFLQILEAISVIGKSVKTELEACLKLRNGAGHPNSLKIAGHRVNAHVETLVLNVFGRF